MEIYHSRKINISEIIDQLPPISAIIRIIATKIIWLTLALIIIEMLFPLFLECLKRRSLKDEEKKSNEDSSNYRILVNKLDSKINQILKSNAFQFKYVVTATFALFWAGLFLYSLSFVRLTSIKALFTSKSTLPFLFQLLGLIFCGFFYMVLYLSIILYSKTLWIFILICVFVFILFFTLLGIKELPKWLQKAIEYTVPVSIISLIASLKEHANEIRLAAYRIYRNIPILAKYLSVTPIIFSIQLMLVSGLLKSTKLPVYYLIPLLILMDWAYNFTIAFSKFAIYIFIDKLKTFEEKEEKLKTKKQPSTSKDLVLNEAEEQPANIGTLPGVENEHKKLQEAEYAKKQEIFKTFLSFRELFMEIPDLCLFSLQMTIFSSISSLKHILSFCPKHKYVEKIDQNFTAVEKYMEVAFQVYNFYNQQLIFNHALAHNDKIEEIENEESSEAEFFDAVDSTSELEAFSPINITKKVFSCQEAHIAGLLSTKNLAIRFALHSAIITHFLRANDAAQRTSSDLLSSDSEPFQLFEIIFDNINIRSIFIILVCLYIVNFILAVESAYLMNKRERTKKKVEEPQKSLSARVFQFFGTTFSSVSSTLRDINNILSVPPTSGELPDTMEEDENGRLIFD